MKGQCFFSFLGGAAIGAVVALLLAPDSGQNTRHKIVDKIKHGELFGLSFAIRTLASVKL